MTGSSEWPSIVILPFTSTDFPSPNLISVPDSPVQPHCFRWLPVRETDYTDQTDVEACGDPSGERTDSNKIVIMRDILLPDPSRLSTATDPKLGVYVVCFTVGCFCRISTGGMIRMSSSARLGELVWKPPSS